MFFSGDDFDPQRLVRRANGGDRRAWDQLVKQYANLVYSVARRIGLDEDAREDVFQQTFLALYRHLDRIEDARTLPKWLATTAAREALRAKRSSSRYADNVPLEDVVAAEDAEADAIALQADEARLVHKGLETLGGRCQQLLTWLYVEERSYQEIDAFGIPVGAIGPTRGRCLEKLRRIMEKLGVSDRDEDAS